MLVLTIRDVLEATTLILMFFCQKKTRTFVLMSKKEILFFCQKVSSVSKTTRPHASSRMRGGGVMYVVGRGYSLTMAKGSSLT